MSIPSWRNDLRVYAEPRVWIIFAFGIMSGFPWVLIGSVLSAWMQEAGVSRSEIGLFAAVFAAYSINFLWSPLVERLKIPLLFRLFGQRRSWLVLCATMIMILTAALSQVDLANELWTVALIAVLIAIFSATQDIAIDAFRIESFAAHEARLQSAGAAMATAGWWTGYSGLGAIPFFLVNGTTLQWQDAYLFLSGILALQVLVVMLTREPARYSAVQLQFARWQEWLKASAVDPITEFFKRSGWKLAVGMLAFIFLFKIGEAFLGRMSIVFYKEIGFTNEEIGLYPKLVTWWVTIIFAMLGSFVNLRMGIVRGLLTGGVAMAASNLMFAWIAVTGPSTQLLLATVLVDGFTSAWSTVAFVAFISMLCSRTFTATQYALLASLGNLGRTLLSSYSGIMVDWLEGDWETFFIITALMVIPSLLILFALRKPLTRLERAYQDELNR